VAVAVWIVVTMGGCVGEEAAPPVGEMVAVELRGVGEVMVFGPGMQWWAPGPEGLPLTVRLADRSLLFFEPEAKEAECLLLYGREDGLVLDIRYEAPVLRVNGRARTLLLDGDTVAWPSHLADADLADLRFLMIDDPAPAHVALLRQLAGVNPRIGIGFGDDGKVPAEVGAELMEAFSLFQPSAAMMVLGSVDSDAGWRELLASWTSIETLVTSADSGADLARLARLPRLRTLVLSDWDPRETGPMPAGLGGLEALVLFGAEMENLESLSALSDLRHLDLYLPGISDPIDVSAIQGLSALRSVGLSWSGVADLAPLYALQELEHLRLPTETTPEELAEVVRKLPGLRSLDLRMCLEIEDLTVLRSLSSLTWLTVGPVNLEGLAGLDSLRNLHVWLPTDKEDYQDPLAEVMRLRESLPDCDVVVSAMPCLGSGHVLPLMAPALLAWILARGRSRRAA
jgi:hypothetical protein